MAKRKEPVFDLDEYEQELSDSFDSGKWQSVPNLKERVGLAKEAARNYFREQEKVTIRVQTIDMDKIRKMAAERGLRPHTYIASVVHQLAAGHIKEA